MFCQPGPLKCMRCNKRSTESQERVYVIKQEGATKTGRDVEKKSRGSSKTAEMLSLLIGREALGSIRRRSSSSRRRRQRRRPNIAITHVGLHSWPVAGSCQIISTLITLSSVSVYITGKMTFVVFIVLFVLSSFVLFIYK